MAYKDCRLQAFGGLRGSLFTSLWWQIESFTCLWGRTWIIVFKPLVAYLDRRSQAFGGRGSHSQAFGGTRGSSFTSLWWFAWIASLRWLMESFTSLWWHTWIVVYMPLVAYVDRRLQALGGRWSHLQTFRGIRGTTCTCL